MADAGPARESLAAVIVNYNAGDALAQALQSLTRQENIDWEAVVVDNASVDDSADAASRVVPWARFFRNRENVGFGRAVNQGVASTQAPFILLMNPDCVLAPGAIAEMLRVLRGDEACAIVGPTILDPDGRVQGSARGDPDMLTGLFGRSSPLRRLMPWAGVSRRNVVGADVVPVGERSAVVDWVSGACMLVRRAAFDMVGGFDERYFLYWEDADLCRRLRAVGRRIRYAPNAAATHQVGRSSATARSASIRAFHRSAYLYYGTHVARGRLNPRRLAARVLLQARCWWRLYVRH